MSDRFCKELKSNPIRSGERNRFLFIPGTRLVDLKSRYAGDKIDDRHKAKGDEIDLTFENPQCTFVLRVTKENPDGRLVDPFTLKDGKFDLDRDLPPEELQGRSKGGAVDLGENKTQVAEDEKAIAQAGFTREDLAKRLFAAMSLARATKELPEKLVGDGVWKSGVEFVSGGKTYRVAAFISDTKQHSPFNDKMRQIDPIWFELEDVASGLIVRFNEIAPSLINRYGFFPRWTVDVPDRGIETCNLEPDDLAKVFGKLPEEKQEKSRKVA